MTEMPAFARERVLGRGESLLVRRRGARARPPRETRTRPIWVPSEETRLIQRRDAAREGLLALLRRRSVATMRRASLFFSCVTLSPLALPVSVVTTQADAASAAMAIRRRCLRSGAIMKPGIRASRFTAESDRARIAMPAYAAGDDSGSRDGSRLRRGPGEFHLVTRDVLDRPSRGSRRSASGSCIS